MSTGNSSRTHSLTARATSAPQAGVGTAAIASNCGVTGSAVNGVGMTPAEKTAAITKVRCLEHDLFDGDRVCRDVTRQRAEAMVVELNQLREALGWLEIDLEGRWRWPHTRAQ